MTLQAPVPPGVTISSSFGAFRHEWENTGYSAVDVSLQFNIDRTLYRLSSPFGFTWRFDADWHIVDSQITRNLLREFGQARITATVLLRSRDHANNFGREIAAIDERYRLADLAAWLGWPDLSRSGGTWPRSISEALAIRCNDYWLFDLAAAVLGVESLTASPMVLSRNPSSVSIIMPAFGVGDIVAGVVESVVEAAHRLPMGTKWECIVVDDANPQALDLPRHLTGVVQVIRSPKRLFCGGARNLGLRAALGDVAVFCDADTHIAPNYLAEHLSRHLIAPSFLLVSLRESVVPGEQLPDRLPDGVRDSRVRAAYLPGRLGLNAVAAPITVSPLEATREFRDFGYSRLEGPTDLQFMAKGNNLSISRVTAAAIQFPPDFIGWGPEDVCFAAKAISRGAFVLPVLSTGVYHIDHAPRSGSSAARDAELRENLRRYARHLTSSPDTAWPLDE